MTEFFGGMMLLLIVFAIFINETLKAQDPEGNVKKEAAKGILSWVFRKLK
jgi:hypothetical protein